VKYSQKYSPLGVKYALHNLFREFVGRLVLHTPNTSVGRPGRFQENVETDSHLLTIVKPVPNA